VATAALSAACSAAPAAVKLPPRPSLAASASPSPSATISAQAQVTAAWNAFWAAGTAAERTRNAARAQDILAATTAPSYIAKVIAGMRADWNKNEVTWGQPAEHILKVTVVTVGGIQQAFVLDCQDASHTGLENAKTSKRIAGTSGAATAELDGTLGLVGGQWKVGTVTFVGTKCTA
jgi:hypothetical protein